jgi:transposase
VIVDPSGIPLAATLPGGNRNDVTQLLALVEGVGPIRAKPGRPRQRPDSLIADRGYDHDNYRRELWARGVKPIIARRATEHGSGLGRMRWVVERTSPGCTNSAACASAGSAAPNCTRPSSPSPARSSASASSELCETSSKHERGGLGARPDGLKPQ